jgi:putative endonuclease
LSYFTYILECADGSLYVGYATDVERRLEIHQAGRGGLYTSKRLPVRLVFQEEFPTSLLAENRERQLKRWTHAKKLALINGDLARLKSLSQSTRTKRRLATARQQ